MKKGVLLFAAILLTTAGLAQAVEFNFSGTLDLTYTSRYIWRGFDRYPHDHSAIQPSLDLQFGETGFGTNIFWSRAVHGGFENAEELDFTLYYGNSFWKDRRFQMDYRFGWTYYNFPDGPARNFCSYHNPDQDFQEVFGSFSWPRICPWGIVPSYTTIRMWTDEGGRYPDGCDHNSFRQAGGWLHVFGFFYDWTFPGCLPNNPEQVIRLSANTVYNDGAGGNDVDHDFSHAVFGLAAPIRLNNRFTFTPGVYYQSSWDDSVNTSDEYWVSLSTSFSF